MTTNNPGQDDPDQPRDPFEALFEQLGLSGQGGQVDFNELASRLQQMFGGAGAPGSMPGFLGFGMPGQGSGSSGGGALDWAQVKQLTRQLSAQAGPDPTPSLHEQNDVRAAARLAELWLDEVCEFPQVTTTPQAWSRAEWIESTVASWKPIVEPIVGSLGEAMTGLLTQQQADLAADDPLAGLSQMLTPMMRQMAAGMYQLQFAQALAALSKRVVSGAEIGFQLLSEPRVTILPDNMGEQFGELELPLDDVRLYLTLRESARQRLFAHVGWLGPQLLAYVEHYASETKIDQSAVESVFDADELDQLTPERMQELSQQLQGKLFEPTRTPEQIEVLGRLETLLALTEGWVDELVAKAASRYMPNHAALAETWRRRRGAGGPAEEVFASLVGLELRPRRVRDAANLWAAVTELRGQVERDRLWSHPDLLPTAAALDDPVGFADPDQQEAGEGDDMDRALAQLLAEESGRDDEV
ncbi:zinc-dependent metalloprotease [Aestuariimicrobium soli]|uniref:zinc-dependent metalloprotease n=1 Tax=Aestuariimicrobium soli TaxID=2035834 RepID=UPI003EBB52A1